jgi:hypothetical protein
MQYKFECGDVGIVRGGPYAVSIDRVGRTDKVAHAIALGQTEDLARYRARRLVSLLGFSQMLTAHQLRQLARLAECEDWRWQILRAVIRSVEDIPADPDDLDTLALAPACRRVRGIGVAGRPAGNRRTAMKVITFDIPTRFDARGCNGDLACHGVEIAEMGNGPWAEIHLHPVTSRGATSEACQIPIRKTALPAIIAELQRLANGGSAAV